MGTELVKAALHPRWAGLSPFARLVWIEMCMRTIDPNQDDPREPRLYYGGHGFLVGATLGRDPEDDLYAAGVRRVERALKELREAGAVRSLNKPRAGTRANYTVHPDDLFTQ